MENRNENNDPGCIEGCALTDVLQQVMSSLSGGYALLCFYEKKSTNPNKSKTGDWEKRRGEIGILAKYYGTVNKSYDDIRRLIKLYSEELKKIESLRSKHADAA